jgi:hypothetical protein
MHQPYSISLPCHTNLQYYINQIKSSNKHLVTKNSSELRINSLIAKNVVKLIRILTC